MNSIALSSEPLQPQTIPIHARNPFVKILPPDCGLPIDDLLVIKSIGVINHQTEFDLWIIPIEGIWQMKQVGDEFMDKWFIDGIDHQHINLRYEGDLDSRCEDLPPLRQYQLIF